MERKKKIWRKTTWAAIKSLAGAGALLGALLFPALSKGEEGRYGVLEIEQNAFFSETDFGKGVLKVEVRGLGEAKSQETAFGDGNLMEEEEPLFFGEGEEEVLLFEGEEPSLDRQEERPKERQERVLTVFLSEYMVLGEDRAGLVPGCTVTEKAIYNQEGRETTISMLRFPIPEEAADVWTVEIPFALRKEYEKREKETSYPLTQDAPLFTDREGGTSPGGAGIFLEETGEESVLVAKSPALFLLVPPGKKDFTLSITQEEERPKAGKVLNYQAVIENTGDLPLHNLTLTAGVPETGLIPCWKEGQGVAGSKKECILEELKKGEIRRLDFYVETEENAKGIISPEVWAQVMEGENQVLTRQAFIQTDIQPLLAAFTVEKTADRSLARPKDTIRYQICIRNTGEKTLHSLVSTERFYSADIRAQFVEMEGVRLNGTKTQAYIEKLLPGESVGLLALVTLPEEVRDESLVNEVIVVTQETGEEAVRSRADVQLETGEAASTPIPPSPTVPAPSAAKPLSESPAKAQETAFVPHGEEAPSFQKAAPEKETPETGDPFPKSLFEGLMVLSFLLSFCAVLRLWARRGKKENKDR